MKINGLIAKGPFDGQDRIKVGYDMK